MKQPFSALAALLVLFVSNAFGSLPLSAQEPAPDFWISNIEHVQFKSKRQVDPIVISFFFVDCLPCRKEIPELYRLIKENHPKVHLLFMDPLGEDTVQRIANLADSLGVPKKYFYHDALGTIARKFNINRTFPTIVGMKQQQIRFRVHDLSKKSLDLINKELK